MASPGALVVDMPVAAQDHQIYDDYLHELAASPLLHTNPCAISITGPRNRIDKITKRLKLAPYHRGRRPIPAFGIRAQMPDSPPPGGAT